MTYEPLNFHFALWEGRDIRFGLDFEHKHTKLDHWFPDRSKACSTLYDTEIGNALIRFIRPGDSVIDAGANIGFFSMFMSQLVGPSGKVLAIEPDDNMRENLELSLQLNDITNVATTDVVLWDTPAAGIDFNIYPTYPGYSSVIRYSNPDLACKTILRRTETLDSLTQVQHDIRCVKLDCEGAELAILRGAPELLFRGVDAIILEFNQTLMPVMGYEVSDVRGYMKDFGYDMFLLSKSGFMPIYVPPQIAMTLRDKRPDAEANCVNVLFSTIDKVATAWPALSI